MRILNFGSLNIDLVYRVDHFVCPGETIPSLDMHRYPGGKGMNQSVALARAGACVYHAGKIGYDGIFLKDLLEQSGVDTTYLQTVDQPSGNALIQVDQNGQNCIILFGGTNKQIDTAFIDTVLENFTTGDLLLLQNEISNVAYIVEKAYEKGMQIALNPSPIDANLETIDFHKITYFILNEIEGEALSGEQEKSKIAQTLHKKYPNSKIMLTLGKDGCEYYDDTHHESCGIFEVKAVDTTAAGDTFTGYFLTAVSQALSPKTAIERACAASAIAVTVAGASTSIPTAQQVDEFLKSHT